MMPTDNPKPQIGPISGDISMAPIMTAVELTFSPTDAIMIAKASTHTLVPRNSTSALMLSIVASGAVSADRLAR